MADHRDRLRSGRDIRLSTATMRALNSRRPQVTSTRRLFPRFLLCLLFGSFVVHSAQAYSSLQDKKLLILPDVYASSNENHDDGDETLSEPEGESLQEQLKGKLLEQSHDQILEPVKHEDPKDGRPFITGLDVGDRIDIYDKPEDSISPVPLHETGAERDEALKQEDEEISLAKKRRRNDLGAVSGSPTHHAEKPTLDHVEEVTDEGIGYSLRFEGPYTEAPWREQNTPYVTKPWAQMKEIKKEKLQRRNDLGAVSGSPTHHAEKPTLDHVEVVMDEGIRRFDVENNTDAPWQEQTHLTTASYLKPVARVEEIKKEKLQTVANEQQNPEAEPVKKALHEHHEPPGIFFWTPEWGEDQSKEDSSLEKEDGFHDKPDDKFSSEEYSFSEYEVGKIRGSRYALDDSDKSKRKSSTVYLNAEEKKTPDGEQQLIVDGQIKKLISIRNDALDAQNAEKPKDVVQLTYWENDQGEQGSKDNKQKTGRHLLVENLIPPETVVYTILQDTLKLYPHDETLLTYIDPKNQTLQELLSYNQLAILQMGEKLLPLAPRQEYSDNMYSCVLRFQYYSCIENFAWPTIKQYYPTLPALPDYQTWYPFINLYPQYPFVPILDLSGGPGELPEVVDTDATRTKRPRPETIIIQTLQNTLKSQSQKSPSSQNLDPLLNAYAARIPTDQLLTITEAKRLIPISQQPEFVKKSIECMIEYSYLGCVQDLIWPTIKQFKPALPDLNSLIPGCRIPELPKIPADNIPRISDPRIPELAIKRSVLHRQSTIEEPSSSSTPEPWVELGVELFRILWKADRPIMPITTKWKTAIIFQALQLIPPADHQAVLTGILNNMRENQPFMNTIKNILWPTAKKYVPSLPEFPSFDDLKKHTDKEAVQHPPELEYYYDFFSDWKTEGDIDSVFQDKESPVPANDLRKKELRESIKQSVLKANATSTRFAPIYTENPEFVILNLLRVLRPIASVRGNIQSTMLKNEQFLNYLTTQQINIINTVDNLLPTAVRTEYINKMIECLRKNNFLVCTRDVTWPTLTQYFPWLPSLPNFGGGSDSSNNGTDSTNNGTNSNNNGTNSSNNGTNSSNNGSNSSNNGTNSSSNGSNSSNNGTDAQPSLRVSDSNSNSDSRRLSETNEQTGLHGDTVVTTTDTRFLPIYNEIPETLIEEILKFVRLSIPNLPSPPSPSEAVVYSSPLTEQQTNIMNIVGNLLPDSVRKNFISKFNACLREKGFLQCTRDVTWPYIGQIYPLLPNLPNFWSSENVPRNKFQNLDDEKPAALDSNEQAFPKDSNKTVGFLLVQIVFPISEDKIESVLIRSLNKTSYETKKSLLDNLKQNTSHLSAQQLRIIRLVECGLPESARAEYIERMLNCTKNYQFYTCTEIISWPTLKQVLPQLPSLPLPPSLPSLPKDRQFQIPCRLPPYCIPTIKKFPSTTPLVDDRRPGNESTGQPIDNLDNLKEKIQLPKIPSRQGCAPDPRPLEQIKCRRRRSANLADTRYGTDKASNESFESSPNITESRYLQLLIRMKQSLKPAGEISSKKQYFVDTLNSTLRNNLTADQYEILKVVEDLDQNVSSKGVMQQVFRCIQSLSFIRCLGIFVWPMISNNLPSLVPSFPSLPGIGLFGRSIEMENKVQEYFGMSASDFENQLLMRRGSVEQYFLEWYKKLMEDEFQTNLGFLKIKGYGNGEIGISFSDAREGRGAKLKDNKNLPSILTIISDIMEEVLDQRPEGEKSKKEKEKKERSIDLSRESDIQFLKDSEEYVDIRRSMNDDEIISLFLDKIKSNDSEAAADKVNYTGLEDAYNAFGVLFGTPMPGKSAQKSLNVDDQLKSLKANKGVDIVPLESEEKSDELKVLSLKSEVTYDLEKESSTEQEEKQRQKRGKMFLKSLIEKPARYLKDADTKEFKDIKDNKIIDEHREKITKTGVIIKLPRLDDKVTLKKMTGTLLHVGRSMKTKMMEMMPGAGLVLSFLIQMALAHARTAATVAGILSNMAMGSAVIGMIRDSFFGSNQHPQIKYVYDNHKTDPGVSWPAHWSSSSYDGGL